MDALLGYWDRDQRCRFANAAYKMWLGLDPEKVVGRSMQDLLGNLYEKTLPYILAALNGHARIFEHEMAMPDGSLRQCMASFYPDLSEDGVAGFVVQVADVTHMKQLERELLEAKIHAERLATHDFLTGLPNRVLLGEKISSAIAQAQRRAKLAAVAILDLDSFKEINDTYGHEAGDAVLKEVAARLKGALRATDAVVRFGGDEFVLIVSEVDAIEGLHNAIERLMDEVAQPLKSLWHPLSPTFSCGVAVYPLNGANGDQLLPAADAAMYEAKRHGKNRIVFAE